MLTKWRKARGWTQEQLAERAECDRSYISQVEKGRVIPGPSFLIAVTNALGAPVTEALVAAGLLKQPAVDENEIAAMLAADPEFGEVAKFARMHPGIVPRLAEYARFLVGSQGDGRESGGGAAPGD